MAEPFDSMRALFPDNTEGDISAADMRAQVDYLEAEDALNIKGATVQNIFVNPGGVDDISDIISGISDAASNKRYLVTINPGEHVTKPVQMKPYVYVKGTAKDAAVITANAVTDTVFTMSDQSTVENVIINGATSGIAFLMNVAGHSHWENGGCTNCAVGIQVDHVDAEVIASVNWNNTNGTGFKVTQGQLHLLECIVLDESTFDNLIQVTGSTSLATIYKVITFSNNMATILRVEDGAQVVASGLSGVNATVGILVSGDSRCVVKSSKFVLCGTGVSMPDITGSPSLEVNGLSIVNNTLDLSIPNSRATLTGTLTCNLINSSIDKDATIVTTVVDETDGDEGTQIMGELKVGTPTHPAESSFGEGDSYAGVGRSLFYTWDGSAFTDITDDASSPSGSTFQFPNGLVDTAIYMASTLPIDGAYHKHGGFKIDITDLYDSNYDVTVSGVTSPASAGNYSKAGVINGQPYYERSDSLFWLFFAQGYWVLTNVEPNYLTAWYAGQYYSTSLEGDYTIVPSSGATGTPTVTQFDTTSLPFVIERYNAYTLAWEEVRYMVTDSGNSYQTYSESLFTQTGSFQVRYNILLNDDVVWTATDPMSLGTEYYWTRIRINSAITTSPTMEQIKLHSNRSEINSDGYLEFFGKARPCRSMRIDQVYFSGSTAAPSSQALFLSDGLDKGYTQNSFDNSVTDRATWNVYLSNDIDTSTPIKVRWSVASDGAGGDVYWVVRWAYGRDGDSVYYNAVDAPSTAPNEQQIVVTQTIPAAYAQYTAVAELDVSKLRPECEGTSGDMLWVSIERLGSHASDTHSGDVALINIQALYASYVLGGHI